MSEERGMGGPKLLMRKFVAVLSKESTYLGMYVHTEYQVHMYLEIGPPTRGQMYLGYRYLCR